MTFWSLFCFVVFIFLFGKKIDVTQAPQKADLIVCLGGGYIERLNRAVELYREGFADKIVFTGSAIGLNNSSDKIGFWKIPFFLKKGLHERDIVHLKDVKNTYEEMREIQSYMLQNHYHKVLIVSDPPHSKRIEYLIDYFAYRKKRLETVIVGSKVPWWSESSYIDSFRSFWEAIKELSGIIYYYFSYEFRNR